MKWLNAVFTRLLKYLAVFAAFLIIFSMVVVASNVFMRHAFDNSIWWVNGLVQYFLGFIPFLAAAWVLQKERHVKMDLVLSRLSQRAQDWATMVTSLLCVLVCLLITWQGVVVVLDYYQIDYVRDFGISLQLPIYILDGIVPVGFSLLAIQFLRRANGCLGRLRTSSK